MRHLLFAPPSETNKPDEFSVALLIKQSSFSKADMQRAYMDHLGGQGVEPEQCIGFTLNYNEANKAPVKFIKGYLEHLLKGLDSLGVRFLYVADSAYFKVLAGVTKADPNLGYAIPCAIKGYEHMTVVLGLNHQALIYNPALQEKLNYSLDTLISAYQGTYVPPGQSIIHEAIYPETLDQIRQFLQSLLNETALTIDIETFSLKTDDGGIGSISFAVNEHQGGGFLCDYQPSPDLLTGGFVINEPVRALLRKFFKQYRGNKIWHNASFDIKHLIFNLFMKHPLDTEGLLDGLDALFSNSHDTKVITYLATNTTAEINLGLKSLAQEFSGNWAVDEIKDIRKLPKAKLLQYNLVDCLSTWFVYNKYQPVMVADNQKELYDSLMLPTLKVIIQMELTGMPINGEALQKTKSELLAIKNAQETLITSSPIIQQVNTHIRVRAMEVANAKLKVKQHPLSHFDSTVFNPNSRPQLQYLLYELMGLPVLDYTPTGKPATGADTLQKLINHTDDPGQIELLTALGDYSKVEKILSTFITAFEAGSLRADQMIWLLGNFNLGGTVSGRLSSSDPNLQNIPAMSLYAKLIKLCFSGPSGWIMAGADFNSLEDYVSALTTKDPNKLKVYTDGYDGHCLRAFSYFKDQMPDIVDTVSSINSIEEKYKHLRQESKVPTFALTYQGTWKTLVKNLGLTEEKAKAIESNYHDLYQVSDQYIDKRLHQASKDGYVDVAFGLRVRAPLLKQVVYGAPAMPHEAASEARTLGNAMGQSYGQLNNRAAVAFMQKVWDGPYRLDVKPIALIHDAIYLLIRDDAEIVAWVNEHLITEMEWQELPELHHPTVKLGASLELYWPTWADEITLPNGASVEEIRSICQEKTGGERNETKTTGQAEPETLAA